jgi:glucan phosphoethanolaminetransferase (alkaline phosphatase superfamily)
MSAKKLLFRARGLYKGRFMTAPSGPTLRIAGLTLLVLYSLAGIIYSCMLPPVGRFPDEFEYLTLTHNLLHGPGYSMDGVHLTASRAPGYSFFMAAIEGIGGGVVAIRICQFLMTGAIVLLLARLAPEENRPAALLAVLVPTIIYPLFFYTAATLYPQTLAAFLFVLAMVMLVCPRRSWAGSLVLGAIFGYLILVVPTFLFTLAVVLVVAWRFKFVRVPDGALIFLVACALIGLWTTRNYIQFHEFVPIASNSGANFLIGNCENTIADGGSGNVDTTRYHQEAQQLHLDEFQEDRYYRQAALHWIAQNPGRATVLYLEKAANFFNVYNEYSAQSRAEVTPWRQWVLGVCYGLLLALLLWRLIEMKRFPLTPVEKLFLAVFVLSAFTQAIFFTRIRLRLPYDYLIVAVIAAHLQRRLAAWLDRAPISNS